MYSTGQACGNLCEGCLLKTPWRLGYARSVNVGNPARNDILRRLPSRKLVVSEAARRPSINFDPVDFVSTRAPLVPDLIQETVKILLETGTKGFTRSAQATNAILLTLREYTRGGSVDPPERVLRKLFERLGATYIKLGQFIASSPTLFPPEYVLEFQKCLDSTSPVSFEVIRKRIADELGQPVESVFERIDPEPLASASVAQVHAAVLKGSMKPVVIKVLKPGVEDVLTADLNFLYLGSRFLEVLSPELSRTSLSGIVSDIRRTIQEEVDFRKEAEHITHFDTYLRESGMDRFATCPYVYKQYSAEKVLTMERFYGAALIDLEAIEKVSSANPEMVLIAALNTWFGSVLQAETFHADVHAGNLLVLSDGRVAFIDFGIVGKINPVTWKAVEALLVSTGSEDFDMMARALATMGATDKKVNIDLLAKDLREIFIDVGRIDSQLVVTQGEDPSVSAEVMMDDEELNRLLLRIVQAGEVHGIKFPREFGLLMKQILYFDRYVKILAPRLNILVDERVNIRSGTVSF